MADRKLFSGPVRRIQRRYTSEVRAIQDIDALTQVSPNFIVQGPHKLSHKSPRAGDLT